MSLHAGQRIAVVGVNGCGKTSLFKLLLGDIEHESGDVEIPEKLRIAHMAQEIDNVNRQARDYIIDGHAHYRQLQAQLAEAEAQDDHNAMGQCHADLDAIDAYAIKHQAEIIMLGLGFEVTDYEKAVADFSGGWRIRLNLARTLLCPSDVLLLDEPTNHLDMEAIQWLEQWLQRYVGSVLLISHDRDFIDASVNAIAHIEDLAIHLYTGSYSDFERQRAEKLLLQQSIYEKQQKRKQELQGFIDRFKAKATKAKQAQSRVKALERMQFVAAVRERSAYQFRIPHADKTGSPLVNWFDVAVGYGDKAIVEHCTMSILPSMRIGLLGANGAGKSTFIKAIAQQHAVLSGEAVNSDNLQVGYFAQHQLEALDLGASPVLHIQRLSENVSEQQARDFLGGYRLNGDMAVNSIENFSGGEKARLALALVAWQKPNLLVLDEPTNHLDIEMREALAEALQAYEGAVVLVSHDRYLLRHCVDEFWLIQQARLQAFDGDLDDYYALKEQQKIQQDPSIDVGAEKNSDNKKASRQQAAENRKKMAPLKNEIKKLEREMEKIDSKLSVVREALSDASIYEADKKDFLKEQLQQEAKLKAELEALEQSWLIAEENLAELE